MARKTRQRTISLILQSFQPQGFGQGIYSSREVSRYQAVDLPVRSNQLDRLEDRSQLRYSKQEKLKIQQPGNSYRDSGYW